MTAAYQNQPTRGATFQSMNSTLSFTQFIGIAFIRRIRISLTEALRITERKKAWRHQTLGRVCSGRWRALRNQSAKSFTWFLPLITTETFIVFQMMVARSIPRSHHKHFRRTRQRAANRLLSTLAGNGVDSTLYFGSNKLFISADLGNSWFAPGGETDLTKGINEKGIQLCERDWRGSLRYECHLHRLSAGARYGKHGRRRNVE